MEDVSLLALLARLVVSLGVVLALMVAAAAVLRRRALPGLGAGRRRVAPIEVIARHVLGKGASVAVVRAGDQTLVLGVTETSVRVLAEADPDAFVTPGDGPEQGGGHRTALPGGDRRLGSAWTVFVDTLRERTVRR
jgi:flagellar biosynthetic protein FliO